MKKRNFKVLFAGLFVCAMAFTYSNVNKEKQNELTKLNLGLISNALIVEPTNHGPAELVECGGALNGKQKKICKCENSIGCSETACF